MKTNLIITSIILLTLCIAMTGTVSAQTAAAGVSKGDTFYYNYTNSWESTDPNATPPIEYVELNNTQWIQIAIGDIQGPVLNIVTTRHFFNGTDIIDYGQVNIDTQVINALYGFLVVGANISANEKLYPSGGLPTINDTILKTYPNGQRETNHYVHETTSDNSYDKTEIYFDRSTGMAIECYTESRETVDSFTSTAKETLTIDTSRSNFWAIPEFPTYMLVLLPAAAIPGVIIAKRKRARSRVSSSFILS